MFFSIFPSSSFVCVRVCVCAVLYKNMSVKQTEPSQTLHVSLFE